MPSSDEIRRQSEAAYGQWCEQWREHAKLNGKHEQKSLDEFRGYGVGKACLVVANGYSLEANIETIKENQGKVDILCCDKTLGHLLRHGITPTFCIVCDANVDFETYLRPWAHLVKDTIVFGNVCANPKWFTDDIPWKDKYFFVNKDILRSEKEFCNLSGCPNVIPAGTNVSNAMVVFLVQADNVKRVSHFAYSKMLLIGFDYSWFPNKNYYAFDKDGGGKDNYMRHMYLYNIRGDYVATSSNLIFSCRWLTDYVNAFSLPVVQCSKLGIYPGRFLGDLAEQMDFEHKPEDRQKYFELSDARKKYFDKIKQLDMTMEGLDEDHYQAFRASV